MVGFETRTRLIRIAELTTNDRIVGFGPVEDITHHADTVVVSNIHGVCRQFPGRCNVEVYDGFFEKGTGRRIDISIDEYKAACRAAQAVAGVRRIH